MMEGELKKAPECPTGRLGEAPRACVNHTVRKQRQSCSVLLELC